MFLGWGRDDPRQWGLPNIRCRGEVGHPEIARYYQAADLLALPSVGEGFPLVVQEAMACGTPALVATETARSAPLVRDVLLTCEPDPESFASALLDAVSSPNRLRRLGHLAAAFARARWEWDVCADQYDQLFAAVLGTRQAQAAPAPGHVATIQELVR
jgi:glycosyltransferase involved in cell wall biosynthesis